MEQSSFKGYQVHLKVPGKKKSFVVKIPEWMSDLINVFKEYLF